jgi:glutathione S-transferase
MALAHKELECETIPVRFTEIANIENGGQTSVPVIRHGENIVADSFKIAQYLRDAYPDRGKRLFVRDGNEGTTRFVEAWSQTQLHGWMIKWAMMDIYNMLDKPDQVHFRAKREAMFGKPMEEIVANRESTIPQLLQLLTPFRLLLKNQPFISGREPAFADFIPFGAFQWLRICSGLAMIPKDEPAMEWFERMLDLYDGLGRSVPEAR